MRYSNCVAAEKGQSYRQPPVGAGFNDFAANEKTAVLAC